MRRLTLALCLVAISFAALGKETFTSPAPYEECLVAQGAILFTSGEQDIGRSIAGAKDACSFTGPNPAIVEGAASASAEKMIPQVVQGLYETKDTGLQRHAWCVADRAYALIRSGASRTIRAATQSAAPKCSNLRQSNQLPAWQVLVAAQMYLSQRLEAESEAQFYGFSGVKRTHTRSIGQATEDPFSHTQAKLLSIEPASSKSPQISIGMKCFTENRAAIFLGIEDYSNFRKDPQGYDILFKINEGDTISLHAEDHASNLFVTTFSNDDPKALEVAKQLLSSRKIAISFRGLSYLLYPAPPGPADEKMLDFCGWAKSG